MLRHSRNLLVMAALCWVAPVSAQQLSVEEPHSHGCSSAGQAGTLVILAEESPGEMAPLSAGRRALLP